MVVRWWYRWVYRVAGSLVGVVKVGWGYGGKFSFLFFVWVFWVG